MTTAMSEAWDPYRGLPSAHLINGAEESCGQATGAPMGTSSDGWGAEGLGGLKHARLSGKWI